MYNIKEVIKSKKLFKLVSKQIFDAVDVDGSGKISEDELWTVVCSLADDFNYERPTMDETQQILRYVDIDRSGVIDINEFRKLLKKVLKALFDDYEESLKARSKDDDDEEENQQQDEYGG